jgi:predicted kinase
MDRSGTLVVLRGNSGSGKSTVARMVQRRFDRATCLVVGQDRVRREMLRERDVAGGLNVELIGAIASWGLDRGLIVVVDGILNRSRYQRMLERLRGRSGDAHFFAWDLDFDETVRRHAQRPQHTDFSAEEMADWYHGWQPLDFVDETRFDADTTAEEAVEVIATAIATTHTGVHAGGRLPTD